MYFITINFNEVNVTKLLCVLELENEKQQIDEHYPQKCYLFRAGYYSYIFSSMFEFWRLFIKFFR